MIHDFFKIASERSGQIHAISAFIHEHPELGFQEYEASARIAAFLRESGFAVEHPAYGLETAIRGLAAVGEGAPLKPRVCVIGEYDALANLGHGCGHNLIAAAAMAAGWTAKTYAERHGIPLNLCFMGTPAEEQFGGKITLLERGAFKDVSLAVMAHGSGCTETDEGALGAAKAYITYRGRASHAAQAPEKGINALDAMVLFYHHLLQWKAAIHPRDRVHGIITDGGEAANIIPDFTKAFFYVRSPDKARIELLKRQLEESVRFGAEKTGCTFDVDWFTTDLPVKVNHPLNDRYAHLWKEAGRDIVLNTGDECRASTDMGNVTQVVPGAQFRFSVNHEAPCPLHSIEFREAAGTDWAFDSALKAGAVMAHILVDYSVDEAFRRSVDEAFAEAR